MDNPFETLEGRLARIEILLERFIENNNGLQPPMGDDMGDINLAMEVTMLKKSTIYSHVFKNKIPFHKRLGKLYFSRKELLDWIINNDPKSNVAIPKPLFPNSTRYKR